MKRFVVLIICLILMAVLSPYFQGVSSAIDGETVQYEIFDDDGKLLTFNSEVFVGDKILNRDFYEYEVYKIEGYKCYARLVRKVDTPIMNSSQKSMAGKQKRKVCLYMTHNDESYTPTDGYDSIYGAGGIHDVAQKFKEELERRKIEVVLDETLHIPHNSSAYSRSSVTATSLLKTEEPDALFDIHRDGVSKKYYYTNQSGKDYSKIRIVVGKSNPNFEENYAFSQKVFAVGNEKYPWLFLDIYCGKGHYNQSLKNTNLLFEMGTYLIEKESVFNSVPYLAETIETAMYEGYSNPENEVVGEETYQTKNEQNLQAKKSNNLVPIIIVGSILGGMLTIALIFSPKQNKN